MCSNDHRKVGDAFLCEIFRKRYSLVDNKAVREAITRQESIADRKIASDGLHDRFGNLQGKPPAFHGVSTVKVHPPVGPRRNKFGQEVTCAAMKFDAVKTGITGAYR